MDHLSNRELFKYLAKEEDYSRFDVVGLASCTTELTSSPGDKSTLGMVPHIDARLYSGVEDTLIAKDEIRQEIITCSFNGSPQLVRIPNLTFRCAYTAY